MVASLLSIFIRTASGRYILLVLYKRNMDNWQVSVESYSFSFPCVEWSFSTSSILCCYLSCYLVLCYLSDQLISFHNRSSFSSFLITSTVFSFFYSWYSYESYVTPKFTYLNVSVKTHRSIFWFGQYVKFSTSTICTR